MLNHLFVKIFQKSVPEMTEDRPAKLVRTKVLAGLAAVAFILLFVAGSQYYATTLKQIVAAPLVFDLKDLPHETWLKVGQSPVCADAPCWVSASIDRANPDGWQEVALPQTELTPFFRGKNQTEEQAYYRFDVQMPSALVDSSEPIAFSPNWVVHGHYDIYLNRTLVQSGSGLTASGDILYQKVVVSVPRSYLHGNRLIVTIRGTLEPQAIGIQHFGKILVGPLSALNVIHIEAERAMGSYYLLFLVIKGGVFIIFALIFAFTRPLPGMGSFVVYAMAVSLENLAIGNFLEGRIPFDMRVVAYFTLKAVAATALLAFIAQVLEVRRARVLTTAFGFAVISLSIACASDYNWGTRLVSIANQHAFINGCTVFVAALGFLGSLVVTLHCVSQDQKIPRRLMGFLAAMTVYLAGLLWCFYVKPYEGFDARAVLDVGLFYYVALASIVEFGLSQVRLGVAEVNVRNAHDIVAKVVGERSARAVLSGANAAVTRDVVVAFIDVRHSSSLMQRHGAAQVITAMNELFAAVHQVVSLRGGEITKFIGDTLLVTWGMTEDHKDGSVSAVLAAFDIRQIVEGLKARTHGAMVGLDVAVGISCGEGIIGRIGASDRYDFTVMGNVVNQARGLTNEAKALGVDVVIGPELYIQVAPYIVAEKIDGVSTYVASCYKVIGTFTKEGVFVTHSALWQSQFSHITAAGLVANAGSNVTSFDLGLRLVA